MPFATRFASPRAPVALAAALTIGLCATSVSAQTQPRQTRPAQPAQQPPAPRQAAPGQAAPGGQPTGPQVVQLKPEPSQTDWTKVCGKDQNTSTEICYTTRDFISEQGQPVAAVAVYDIKGPQTTKVIRFLMPLGLLLKPGIRFTVDQGQPTPGAYAVCFPNGCFAEAPVKDDVVNALKKATTINVSVQNQATREVTFQIPAAGFGKAFDGPPIDPKVLQDQQKKLQEELEKRSDELRKRLESNAAAGAAGPAAAAPAGTAPKP